MVRPDGTWEVPNKTARKTRTIYLTPDVADLGRRLADRRPDGPIFRNTVGNPWTRNAVALRFGRLRKKLGMGPELAANALRHLFATDALEKGVPVATVAELLGHRDATMVMRVYSKLAKRSDHLKMAAARARGDGNDGPPGAGR